MYPEADVPVVMVSVDASADPQSLFEMGQKPEALREEGIMIICSGNVVHNLRLVNWRMRDGEKWADDFDVLVRNLIEKKDYEAIVNFPRLKDWQKAIPTTEHFFPLLVALGAAGKDSKVTVWNEYRELGSMSMTSYLFE
jgi:4,5-DOPA dioxygenase extradiol